LIRHVQAALAVAATATLLAACGSSSGGGSGAQNAAPNRLAESAAATHPAATSSAPAGPTIDLASVDTCALLSPADANSAAHAEMLDEFQTASTVYTLTATKQPDAKGSSCAFRIQVPQGDDGSGSVVFHVRSAAGFTVPPDGEPIAGLGTQAYDTGVSPVVRVGNVVISSDDNSFPDSLTVALLRKMVPKLK
jgi:hypothetical protein